MSWSHVRPTRPSTAFSDVLNYSSALRPVTVDLTHGTANGQGSDTLRIDGSVQVIGGPADDNLFGSRYAERLVGRSGLDRLEGRGGDDELYGDRLFTGTDVPGRDALYGGKGTDVLGGGAFRDLLDGGPGNDLDVDVAATNTCRDVERHNPRGC